MPGHIKKSEGPDPDPDPWLVVSPELRVKLKSKPYDAKKSCWVPDKATGGYWEGLIDSTDGDKVTVTILETKDVSFLLHISSGAKLKHTGPGLYIQWLPQISMNISTRQ